MSKDSYGFVVNRVLVPMINEAINCVYEGLATPEDVDQMMKLGAIHPMPPSRSPTSTPRPEVAALT